MFWLHGQLYDVIQVQSFCGAEVITRYLFLIMFFVYKVRQGNELLNLYRLL